MFLRFMKVGILFSGGKDSTLATYLAKKNNYDISCLITIFSENKESYMFHTPSISKTKQQAKAMKIPIIVQKTKGEKEIELRDLEKAMRKAKKDFKIEQIKFIEKRKIFAESEKKIQVYNTKDFRVVDKDKETIVTFSTVRQPLTLLKINTNDSNFSRTVIVEGSNNIKRQKEWRHIASGRISRINAGTFHKEEITINFNAPVRFSYYRIKVNNFDSPALDRKSVV